MTPQEQQMLDGLIGRVQSTQLTGKDNEAEARIQAALGRNPDALYILCQTVLVQGYALDQATAQLQAARQQLAQAQANAGNHPGFLEKIFGSSQPQAPANSSAPVYNPPGYGTQPQQAYPPPPYPQQGYPAPGYGGGQSSGGFGGGGFLQGALQTAAGVAMGEMAVQSIEGLVRGFGREAGYGSDRALGGFDREDGRNFAGDSDGAGGFGDRLRDADGSGPGLSDDIEDRRGEGSNFFGGTDNSNTDSFADSGNDDSQGTDFSGNDDSFSGNDDSGDNNY